MPVSSPHAVRAPVGLACAPDTLSANARPSASAIRVTFAGALLLSLGVMEHHFTFARSCISGHARRGALFDRYSPTPRSAGRSPLQADLERGGRNLAEGLTDCARSGTEIGGVHRERGAYLATDHRVDAPCGLGGEAQHDRRTVARPCGTAGGCL